MVGPRPEPTGLEEDSEDSIIETTSQYSSPVNPTTANTTSDVDSPLNLPHCDRIFSSRIGLVVHLRIHSTKTGEKVPGAPTHSTDRRLYCPHCPRAFTHRMGLFGHMVIHDSGIHCNAKNTNNSCTPSSPNIFSGTAIPTTMNEIPLAPPNFSRPHCACNFNSRIGLVSHMLIHRTETG
ncbi:unnamed protein product [Schistocephalus solidus]|uniref:C2H2-type domain-containing protein n=1 Tax=Schistocephalus solidus TaxID=70667 RepID=A0A183SQ50_SCHSO|nr:unnamed protein product [Schistocephalus solidus]